MKCRLRKIFENRQSGFFLVELILVLLVMSIVAGFSLSAQREELLDSRAIVQGKAMQTIQAAQNTYIVANYSALANNQPVLKPDTSAAPGARLNDPYNPTMQDLIDMNVGLPVGYSGRALNDGNYHVRIEKIGCPSVNCSLEAVAWIDKPFIGANGLPDMPRLGLSAKAIGPDSGYSTVETPAVFNTLNGLLTNQPNPNGSVAGTLLARSGYSTQSMNAFMRRDGLTPMTNRLDMGNNDLAGARNIAASGELTVSGAAKVNDYVQPGAVANNGSTCAAPGSIGRDGSGNLFVCN